MKPTRHLPVSHAPNQMIGGGAILLGISLAMSMTFFEANWRNERSVVTVLGILAFGALGGAVLMVKGLGNKRRRARFGEIWLETPAARLPPGASTKVTLGVQPDGDMQLTRRSLTWRLVEWAEREGESMNREEFVHAEGKIEAEKPLKLSGGKAAELEGVLQLPAGLPGTFRGERHAIELELSACFADPEVGELVERFAVDLVPSAADVSVDEGEPEEGARIRIEGPARTGAPLQGTVEDAPEGATVVAVLSLRGGTAESVEAARAPVREGAFALELPEGLPGSYQGPRVEASWSLRLEGARGPGCELDLRVESAPVD